MGRGVRREYKGWRPPGRALHLVDVENLLVVPDSQASGDDIVDALESYRQAAPVRGGDLAVVGCQRRLAIVTTHAWPAARQVWGYGLDGADRA